MQTTGWKFLPLAKHDFNERAKCEEIEMEACFVAAKDKRGVIAKEKCGPALENARVEVVGLIRNVGGKIRSEFDVANVRGRDLLGSNDVVDKKRIGLLEFRDGGIVTQAHSFSVSFVLP